MWMAQVRAITQAYQSEFMDCLAAQGVEGFPADVGFAIFTVVPRNSDGSFDLIVADRNAKASTFCSEMIMPPSNTRQPPDWEIEVNPEAYHRMLDVRKCLIANGINVPNAPSERKWTQSDWPWNPWAAWDHNTLQGATNWRHLGYACPQDGVSIPFQFRYTQNN
jgi:hypothetical protein